GGTNVRLDGRGMRVLADGQHCAVPPLKRRRHPADIPVDVTSERRDGTGEAPLWLTVRGASMWLPLGWAVWIGVVAVAATELVGRIGAAGAILIVGGAGWLLATRLASPLEWLRRYHLDDVELTAMGPGSVVQRIPWRRVHTLTQERRALRVAGDGLMI